MKRFATILLTLFLGVNGELRLELDDDRASGSWKITNQNGSIEIPGQVPGGIYTDLQAAGILDENLFYRFNDIEYRWVAKDTWTYEKTFDVPAVMLGKRVVNLVLHGVDTVGEVYLNDERLGDVENMFVRYVFPIQGICKENGNVLKIVLKSPIEEAKRLADVQNEKYNIPPSCPPEVQNGECHRNFLRKMQASFSWDWGPAFPSVGIWKSVEVEAFDLGVIRDVTAYAFRSNDAYWVLRTTAFIEYPEDSPASRSAQLSAQLRVSNKAKREVVINAVSGESYRDTSSEKNVYVSNLYFNVDPDSVELWWPNGYGKQPLYEVAVVLQDVGLTESSSKTIRVGFRSVRVVQEEVTPDAEGLSFYFEVNGVPIFAKGSNWIPGHILPELGNDENTIRHALKSAKESNMNMLRVWGGGVYESDLFYSIADELGILIWQDMMFAVSMYPADEKFLKNVQTEVQQQMRRLQYHPSIAIWAGNNENEEALASDWFKTASNSSLYAEDYVKLYVDTIKPLVKAHDEFAYYAISSPSNGLKTEEDGFLSKKPQSGLYGDVHFYAFFGNPWTPSFYPTTRFASEYGFQSMPSFETMSRVSLPEDRKMHSEFSIKRQHSVSGSSVMTAFIRKNLPLPEDDESEEYYKTFIYYSQINQAVAIKTETEKYRRDRSKLDEKNLGLTMGALYWQLNDVWQAPTWSSIEFGGKWKMLQYYAKKFFSPVLVSPEETESGNVNVYLVSDLLEDVPDVNLNVSVYAWDDMTPRATMTSTVLMKNATSEQYASYVLDELLESSECKREECFLYFSASGPNFFTENVLFLTPFYQVKTIQQPEMTVEVSETEVPSEVQVRVTTDKIAPFVWLETEVEGEFSDNGFLMIDSTVNLIFKERFGREIDVEKMKSSLQVVSLVPQDIGEIKRKILLGRVIAEGLAEFAKEGIKKLLQ